MTAIANLVEQTSTTTGTGNITLSAVNGRESFNDAFGTGGTDAFYYFVMHRTAAEWEVGTGHLLDATTLVRDTIINSSNADAAVNFSAGTKDVTNAVAASDVAQLVNLASTANGKGASLIGIEDSGDLITATTVEGALTEIASDLATNYQPLDADLTSWAGVTRSSGFDTFVATPSSANLAAFVTGETGSGALVFGTDPTFSNDITVTNDILLGSGSVINFNSGDVTITHSTNTLAFAGASSGYIFNDGSVGIRTASPQAPLDVAFGDVCLLFGADAGASTRTDATPKYSQAGSAHYTNAEEPCALFYIFSGSSSTLLRFGGGTTQMNTATGISFWTAANTTTTIGTERMGINSAGAIRFNAYGAGTLTTDASGNITATSDERLKDNIASYVRGLSDVMKINPIAYNWSAASGLDRLNIYAGFSAQNIESAIPEAVGVNANGFLSVQERPILAALVNSVKELSTRLSALEAT